MKRVLTVGCEIPGGFGEYVDFKSKASLLDADFVLFHPNFGRFITYYSTTYQGKPALEETSSFQLKEALNHWRRELNDFLRTGKTVFLLLSDREEVFIATGEKKYSGTGRNRHTTNIVSPVSNYDSLPFVTKVVESKGSSMKLLPGNPLLRDYWEKFAEDSHYRVYIENSDTVNSLVATRDGSRVVGAMFRTESGGALVALPWIDFDRDNFVVEDEEDTDEDTDELVWTPAAQEWGRRFVGTLESLDNSIKAEHEVILAPQWVLDDAFKTNLEVQLTNKRSQLEQEIAYREAQLLEIGQQLTAAGSLKPLLFEQGRPLEKAVLQAMKLMGFEATNYRDSDSEFDAVLVCPEGRRCIGEVEGRDSKAIGIDKMRQLAGNIQEDFARDEVSELAKGVLFGNAYRLKPPSERSGEHFTDKCMKMAKMNGAALIRTCDLFEVARALADTPDPEFAASCRAAIFSAHGTEVTFPAVFNQKAA